MSLWGTHFGVGAVLTAIAVFSVAPRVRHRYVIIVLGGGWAILPDIHWVLPPLRSITKPVVHDSPLANLFWFHGWLDAWDVGDSATISAVSMVGLVVVLVALEVGIRLVDGSGPGPSDEDRG